jgi:hypothetical protein
MKQYREKIAFYTPRRWAETDSFLMALKRNLAM